MDLRDSYLNGRNDRVDPVGDLEMEKIVSWDAVAALASVESSRNRGRAGGCDECGARLRAVQTGQDERLRRKVIVYSC